MDESGGGLGFRGGPEISFAYRLGCQGQRAGQEPPQDENCGPRRQGLAAGGRTAAFAPRRSACGRGPEKNSTRESRWRQFLLFAATSPSDSRSSWRTAITGSARSVISTRARPFAAASQAGGGDREFATRVKRCPPMSRRPTPASSCTRSSSNRWASASMRWQSHSCHPQPHQRHPPPATGHHGGHCAAPPQWFMNMQSNG